MTTKQRAYLKGLAQNIDPVLSLGKASLTPEFVEATSEALKARELIKVNVLKNCVDVPASLAITLSERTRSEVVQVIGRKIVLYKRNMENPKILFLGSFKGGLLTQYLRRLGILSIR
jgi:RNA-binding protein